MTRLIRKSKITVGICAGCAILVAWAQNPAARPPRDAVAEAQQPQSVKTNRPDSRRVPTTNRTSSIPAGPSLPPLRFKTQPKEGKISGFDFARDPLNADRPHQDPEEIMKKEIANKPNVMAAQRKLLESRYILEPKLDPQAKMSRGKPLPVGPTARLQGGMTWQQIGELSPEAYQAARHFPLSSPSPPSAGEWRTGFSEDADRHVSPPGALRCGLRSSGGFPSRVPASDLPK